MAETWHEVGDTGEPAFENSWVNYDTTFNSAAFRKDALGFVHLKGLVKSGVAATIFTLPTGYRPSKQCLFCVYQGTDVTIPGRIDILTSGNINLLAGGSVFTQLDGIIFYAG